MPSSYAREGVRFTIPDQWEVVEDDLDKVIRAITLDTPLQGSCMVDLYKPEQAPELNEYIDNQVKHFAEALPFGFKIVGSPIRTNEKTFRRNGEIEGETVKLQIRSIFLLRSWDVNSFYRLQSGRYTGLCSLRCSEEAFPDLKIGFGEFLESFEAE